MPLDSIRPMSTHTKSHLHLVVACMLGAVFLMACASPVGVTRANPKKVRQELTATVSIDGKLEWLNSQFPAQELHGRDVCGQAGRGDRAPSYKNLFPAAIEGDPVAHAALISLSELAFKLADEESDGAYFLSSMTYAWAYLFPRNESLNPSGYEPWLRFRVGPL